MDGDLAATSNGLKILGWKRIKKAWFAEIKGHGWCPFNADLQALLVGTHWFALIDS